MWISVVGNLIQYGLVALVLYQLWRAGAGLTQKRFLQIVLTAAFLLRLGWVLYAPYEPTSDYLWYHQSAIGLSQGGAYGPDGVPSAFWPIGYPFFLSLIYRLFGARIIAGQAANIILGCLSVYLTFALANHLFGERIARAAAIIMALFIGQIYYTALLCSEILSQTLFLLALYVGVRAPAKARPLLWQLSAGVCVGLGVLTRPVVGILIPSLLLIWLSRRLGIVKSLAAVAIVSVAMCLTIAPWTIRNYRVFHQFVPVSTNAGIGFWWGNNVNATGSFHLYDYSEGDELVNIGGEVERDRECFRRGFAFIRQHPLRWAVLLVKKPYYLYESDEQGLWFSFVKPGKERPEVPRWLYALWVKPAYAYYGAICLLTCFGVVWLLGFGDREKRVSAGVLLIPTVLLTLFYALFHTENRYNHTVMPLLVIVAACGLCQAAELLFRRREKPALAPV